MKKFSSIFKRALPFCAALLLLISFSFPVSAYTGWVSGMWTSEDVEVSDFTLSLPFGSYSSVSWIDDESSFEQVDKIVFSYENSELYLYFENESVGQIVLPCTVDFGDASWYCDDLGSFKQAFIEVVPDLLSGNPVTGVFPVFNGILDWLSDAFESTAPLFYSSETGLTFVGTLAVTVLSLAVVFLVIRFIRNFLVFRG